MRVLLVAENEMGFSLLCRQLEEQGCRCAFASSYSDAVRLFADQPFDLVLSSGQPGIRALFSSMAGSSASLFCAHAVEDGCLWVPVILKGSECLGTPPLHPSEFAERLTQMVDEIKLSRGRAGDSVAAPSWP